MDRKELLLKELERRVELARREIRQFLDSHDFGEDVLRLNEVIGWSEGYAIEAYLGAWSEDALVRVREDDKDVEDVLRAVTGRIFHQVVNATSEAKPSSTSAFSRAVAVAYHEAASRWLRHYRDYAPCVGDVM